MTRMGNKSQGGLFAPIVVLVKKAVGDKQFNQLRGTAISKHSQGELQTYPLHESSMSKSFKQTKHHQSSSWHLATAPLQSSRTLESSLEQTGSKFRVSSELPSRTAAS